MMWSGERVNLLQLVRAAMLVHVFTIVRQKSAQNGMGKAEGDYL
jgi:hypothetical protein